MFNGWEGTVICSAAYASTTPPELTIPVSEDTGRTVLVSVAITCRGVSAGFMLSISAATPDT
jgi:hypothetical protein